MAPERHIMIDLETLSTRTNAAIVSIGAVEFDPHGDDRDGVQGLRKRFYARVRAEVNNPNFHVDYDTLCWWMQQSKEARTEFANTDRNLTSTALSMFSLWLRTNQGLLFDVKDIVIWSHENFDLPILTHAYDVSGLTPPFWYRSGRDIRTIIHAAFGRNLDVEEEVEGFPKNPNSHHPVYDAWHQAVMVQECFRRLAK